MNTICVVDWTAIGTFLLFFATVALVLIAYSQLKKIEENTKDGNRISSADFIERLKNDFFTDKTRLIFTLVEVEFLEFTEIERNVFFEIKIKGDYPSDLAHDLGEGLKRHFYEGKKILTAYEIDDLLLGPLCDLGDFYDKGVIEADLIYHFFGYYIIESLKNEQIKTYIDYVQKKEWPDYCRSLQKLYEGELKNMKKIDQEKYGNKANKSSY